MSIFLLEAERKQIGQNRGRAPLSEYVWAIQNRARKRAANPGLISHDTTCEWWHCAAEYLTDAAMAHALNADETLASWLRSTTLSIIRRSEDDWIGPWFRDHQSDPPQGHLETAHLSWAVAVALDLAGEVFTETEQEEVREVLKARAIPLCRTWLERCGMLHNWRSILTAGLAVAAAVIDDREQMEFAADCLRTNVEAFQTDGSYGESLQYANYAMYGNTLAYEGLVRREPAYAESLTVTPYARSVKWTAQSMLYMMPLSGWGAHPRPRAANFNDSAAIFSPTPDVMLHISARTRESDPELGGIARWLSDQFCPPTPPAGPQDRASFGFINRFTFLTIPLLGQAAEPIAPRKAELPLTTAFSNGDAFARDAWDGNTILAIHGASEDLHTVAHSHKDLNTFILTHRNERLLADPGHSCYRSLIRHSDIATETHNTCTFRQDGRTIAQPSPSTHRKLVEGKPGPVVTRGGKRLIADRIDDVTVIGSEIGEVYGDPIRSFARFWVLAGSNALFIVDYIASEEPVKTTWNWILNNRDDELELKIVPPDRLVARRGQAGMKLFHLADGKLAGPEYGYIHDAYHPLPNQPGEGASGSGTLIRWNEKKAQTERIAVHAIAMDGYGEVAGWHLKGEDQQRVILEGPGRSQVWALQTSMKPIGMEIEDLTRDRRFGMAYSGENYELRALA